MYAKEEIYLGNQTLEMSNILSQAVEDCNTIVKALKFYKVIPEDFNFIKFLDEIYEIKVVVDLKNEAISQCYDYEIPNNLEDFINVGTRVLVPFGFQDILGYVIELNENSDYGNNTKQRNGRKSKQRK